MVLSINMDVQDGLTKQDPELQVRMNIENENDTSTIYIKTERDEDTEFPNSEVLGNNIKLESDYMLETYIKHETIIPEVKPEMCLDMEEYIEEGFPPLKIEEIMLKSENFDNDTGAHSENQIQDDATTKHNDSSEKKYSCDNCDYKTPLICRLKYHKMAKHDNTIKKYCCDLCDYRSHQKCHLKNHIMMKHCSKNNKRHDCQLCDFKTCYKNSLKNHIMIMHDKNSVKKHCCQFCDYKSYQKYHLNCHVAAKHDRNFVKKYSCNHCDYRNNERNKLKRHMWTHHDENRPRRYGCDLCKYKSNYKTDLKRHMLNQHQMLWKPPKNNAKVEINSSGLVK